jgi:predicted methyltransferase
MQDLIKAINTLVEAKLAEQFQLVSADKCGIDPRAAYKIWANEAGVIIHKSDMRTFNYYGGAEYVDSNRVGDYVFYDARDRRVADWLDAAQIIEL